MSKVICDICGTVYQDTAESCPICGYSQFPDIDLTEEDLLAEETLITRNKGGRYVETSPKRKNKEIFDFDEANPDDDDEEDEDYGDEDDEEEESKSNAGLVITLVIVIMLLLGAVLFVFYQFFLPTLNGDKEVETPTTEAVEIEATETEATTEPTIPCTDLILNEAPKNLSKEGQFYLLNVKVLPADTTDSLVFVSGDETIATVTENGRIVAVGEGETTVYITCGKQQINCPVIVKYEEETQPPTEETQEESDETADETEAAEEETVPSDVVLKLKRDDISLNVGYGYTIELDCELDPSQVEWSVEHGHIASVDEKGFVLAKSRGTTAVIVKYGDQEIQCIIRCK